jgi:hypothetical protein
MTQGIVHACQCQPHWDPAVEYEQVDAVFKGFVVDISPSTVPYILHIQVIATGYWKGSIAPLMNVYTYEGDGSCGYTFQVGDEYLIYATEWDEVCCPGVFTSICNRTRFLSNAGTDLAFLGDPLPVPVEQKTWGAVKTLYRD